MARRHVRDLISLPEVAKRLGISSKWLKTLISRGDFPQAYRISQSGVPQWREEDVTRYIRQRAEMSGQVSKHTPVKHKSIYDDARW